MSVAAQLQRTAATYYMIREGKPPNAIIAIHRVYDSAVACFQLLMNTGAVETLDMWGVCVNDRGLKTVEWIIHSYVRATPTEPAELNQHGAAGIHREEQIAPLRVPEPPPPVEEGMRYSP